MRYYTMEISDRKTGKLVRRFSSVVNGHTDPGALNLELDVPVMAFAQPLSQGGTGAFFRLWGISLEDVSQASNFNGMAIKVFAGMARGLPLANPQQAGLICDGYVFQCFGNWIGTNMTLDFVVLPDTGSDKAPKNLVLTWPKGTELGPAVEATLRAAFPTSKISVDIRKGLVRGNDEPGYYASLPQLSRYVQEVSQDIVGGDSYRGVQIVLREGEFRVRDGSSKVEPKELTFFDLIGQPTWVEFPTIQVSAIMRADLFLLDYIKLPPGLQTTTVAALSQFRDKSVFQGVFQIVQLRHVGCFRQADGESWITTMDAFPIKTEVGKTKGELGFAVGGA